MKNTHLIKVLIGISLFFSIAACSCKKDILKDDKLSLQKQAYIENGLRTDGYYYHVYGSPALVTIYFFYNNGLVIDGGAYDLDKIDEYESIINTTLINKINEKKYSYGLFNIQDDRIKFEHWSPFGLSYNVWIQEGVILNDTTFKISSNYRVDGSNYHTVDWIYHFKQFSPKPDSTNKFIP